MDLKHESLLGLRAQFLERRSWIQQRLGSNARRFVLELGPPLVALPIAIDGAARIKPAPTKDRLQAVLRARRVLDQIFIGPTKLFERWLLVIAWVDGFDGSDSQQLREGLGVIVIGLVAVLDQLVVAWIADRDRGYQGRSEEHTSELQSLRHLV